MFDPRFCEYEGKHRECLYWSEERRVIELLKFIRQGDLIEYSQEDGTAMVQIGEGVLVVRKNDFVVKLHDLKYITFNEKQFRERFTVVKDGAKRPLRFP